MINKEPSDKEIMIDLIEIIGALLLRQGREVVITNEELKQMRKLNYGIKPRKESIGVRVTMVEK